MGTQYPLFTISGPPASGTSTISKYLKEELNFELINGGDIFRQIAADRGLSVGELNEYAKTTDEIDKELDSRLKDIIDQHIEGERSPDGDGLIVESRLAGWHSDGRATLSIYLHAPLTVRASRLTDRSETAEELARREQAEKERYQEYYGINVMDTTIYDIIINTENNSIEDTVDKILEQFKNKSIRAN